MGRHVPSILIAAALAIAGCGPDAARDNPLDVPSTGVYGTTYRRNGGILAGVSVAATPANKTTVSDGQGNYALELTGGSRQTLQFAAAERQNEAVTIDIPERGLVQHNVILNGQVAIDTIIVRTGIERLLGDTLCYIQPYLVAHHPDGSAYLNDYNYQCKIDTVVPMITLIEIGTRGDYTKIYSWRIDAIPGYGSIQGTAGRPAEFYVSSPSFSALRRTYIQWFLEPPPDNLRFLPPDTLGWTNGRYDVNIAVEVYNGASLVWAKDTTNIEQLLLPAALAPGSYRWRVIQQDRSGNSSLAEATFTRP